MTAVLPPARVAIAGNAPPSREWYRYFQAATQVNLDVGTLRHDVDALTVRVTALEDAPPSSGDVKITGAGSIYVSATAVKVVSLEGDAEDPGFTTYYGTDSTGAKGWYAVSDALASSGNIAKSIDAAGVTSFDLVDLADSGTGAALVKITRDAKGRISGTSAATTTDLAEGDNLYFTDARVRATALTGLSTATATPVTATDSVLVGVGKLQGQASAAATAIAGKEPSITPGTTAQYWRGDKTWQALDKAAVGLGNVDNTSDADKPVSTAQAAALAPKSAPVFSSNISVDGAAGTYRVINWTTGGLMRWAAFASNQVETGSDAGSNWFLNAYHDDGSFAFNAVAINRVTGGVTFSGPVVAPNIVDTGWQALTPQNSWSNLSGYATLACRKVGSLVTVRGVLSGGTTTDGTLICTLPAGFRPPATLVMAAASNSTDPTARFGVAANGQITITKVTSASFLSLSMDFYAD